MDKGVGKHQKVRSPGAKTEILAKYTYSKLRTRIVARAPACLFVEGRQFKGQASRRFSTQQAECP
jgi:hypothetical protein